MSRQIAQCQNCFKFVQLIVTNCNVNNFKLCRYYDEINKEMTEYIKKSVKGVIPDATSEVLDGNIYKHLLI